MKYRSYNSEILICTTLLVDVFNDIIIDRRKHGLKRDYSKPITLSEIVQKNIEVPCILGDRGVIMRSLENEPGRYKMPLIILQMKDMKTDTNRMYDLHADIFYQQDSSFADLNYDNPMFRPQELFKKRGQPLNLTYDITIMTRYREDLDEIISNFSVHFRPDIYLKWWHPGIKTIPLESQLTWTHGINIDNTADYNPQNIFLYKGSTSFTLKSWLFYGMRADDNEPGPEMNSIIEKIKIFPTSDDNQSALSGYSPDDIWVFGNVLNTPDGISEFNDSRDSFGFWGMETDQDFIGSDPEQMQNGQYAINNVFAENYEPISGDPVISNIKLNKNVGDFITRKDRLEDYNHNQYQYYLELDATNEKLHCEFKNVYFKGSFPESSFISWSPSGDYVFRQFFKSYLNNEKAAAVFGDTYILKPGLNVNYDIKTKDLTYWGEYEDQAVRMFGRCCSNSETGYWQEFELLSKPVINGDPNKFVKYMFHREFDSDLNHIKDNDIVEKYNIRPIEDFNSHYQTELLIENTEVRNTAVKIKNFIKTYWKKINLQETKNNTSFDLIIEDARAGDVLKEKGLESIPFRTVGMIGQVYEDNYYYQILANSYIYLVMKVSATDPNDADIYDFGLLFQMKYCTKKAMIYEVLIPESRELLGVNFRLKI